MAGNLTASGTVAEGGQYSKPQTFSSLAVTFGPGIEFRLLFFSRYRLGVHVLERTWTI